MPVIEELKKIVRETHLREHEPMRLHTTFQIGGEAEVYVTPSREELSELLTYCKAEGVPFYIIGNGSNLLVSDKGLPGVVIEIGKELGGIEFLSDAQIRAEGEDPALLKIGAGERLARAATFAAEQSLRGLEFAQGIPGNVGGAVYMNAGAYDGEIKNVLKEAELLYLEDDAYYIKTVGVEALELSYRHSALMETSEIVLSATICLERGDRIEIMDKMQDFKSRRSEKQPLNFPSAGSAFKRPEGHFAAKLIEEAGLKGFAVGSAQVSEKHCGFIVNRGGASASDVKNLMEEVIRRVKVHSGVTLEPEIRMLGEF